MRTFKSLLAVTTALTIASAAWADGGPTPESEPPLPPEPVAVDEPESTAPPSHNNFVMTLEVGAGWSLIDDDDACCVDDDSYPLMEGAARANVPLNEDWALQLDAEGLATFTDRDNGEENLQTAFSGAAHLNWRQPSHALGVFVQAGSANGGEDENSNFYNFGAEGLYNWTDLTGILQAGYMIADDEDEHDTITDAWWVRAVARFYAGEDTRFQAEGTYADGEEDEDTCNACRDDETVWGWGGRIDHSFTGGPVAVFLSYNGNRINNDDSGERLTDHSFLVGLNVRFGDADSLKEADRTGPSFDTPDVGRWTGWTTGVVN